MIALVGGAVALERRTINHLLEDDAAATASAWTELLAQDTNDLASIAAGNPPPADLIRFVDRVKSVANIFLYKVYDAHGTPRFVSDNLPEEKGDTEGLAEHNPEAAEAIASGAPTIEVKTGEPPSRPAYYSEAYVPRIGKDGQVVAVVESYIDQTVKRAEFERTFVASASALGLLIAIAFGIPAGAWYRRQRDKERAEARVAYLASFDALSGLANRTSLTNSLAGLLTDAGGRFVAVHCVDIDSFKDINGRFGFAFGDQMLKWTAERLRSVAGHDDIVARLAGDEFAVIQVAPRNRADVEVFARKIVAASGERATFSGHEITPTVGVGIAMYPDHGRNAERLIRCAEMALAKGKSEGRGRIRFFSADLDVEAQERLTLESAIEHALDTGGFMLHFQPLYSEPDERLVGFEALARLPTADGGFIPPSSFIPAAERMGMIGKLSNWVLQEACAAATNWAEHLTVSVNLSPAQFGKDTVSDVVATALAISGLKPSRLLLEITESLLLHDSDSVMRELAHLKSLGPAIVMDDFGTGYSSLGYLWRFAFDKIKIDGSFMRALGTPDAPAEKIVRSVSGLGHMLGMRVCLEGVENDDQARYARAIGCDEVQGFYFGRPVPATQVAAVILRDFKRDRPAAAAQTAAVASA